MATYNLKVYLSDGTEVDNLFAIPEISSTGETGKYIEAIETQYGAAYNQGDIMPTIWSDSVSHAPGGTIWCRQQIVLSDGSDMLVYSKAHEGSVGEDGSDGTPGTWISNIEFKEV